MNNRKVLVQIMVILSTVGACAVSDTQYEVSSAHQLITTAQNLPYRNTPACDIMEPGCERNDFQFDVNDYFQVFNRLSIEEGYNLDYVYLWTITSGQPIIYTYKDDESPYSSFNEFTWQFKSGSPYRSAVEYSDEYLKHILIEYTPEGYFQYAALSIIDNQFYLYWHSDLDSRSIIATEEYAVKLFTDIASSSPSEDELDSSWGRRIIRKIRKLDYTPKVEMNQNRAIVRFVVFSKWEGFSEIVATIGRDFPHEIISWNETILVEYSYGIIL